MEKNVTPLEFNQTDITIFSQFIGKNCDISFKKVISSEYLGSLYHIQGIVQSIGNRLLLVKTTYKKKNYSFALFLDHIASISIIDG